MQAFTMYKEWGDKYFNLSLKHKGILDLPMAYYILAARNGQAIIDYWKANWPDGNIVEAGKLQKLVNEYTALGTNIAKKQLQDPTCDTAKIYLNDYTQAE